jgi:hypothetical protein
MPHEGAPASADICHARTWLNGELLNDSLEFLPNILGRIVHVPVRQLRVPSKSQSAENQGSGEQEFEDGGRVAALNVQIRSHP